MFRSKENSSISNMSQVIREKKKASTILIFFSYSLETQDTSATSL